MGHGDKVIRIKYGKQGAGKYISHLDTIRAAERAIRRMGLPLLYSEGFTPRPRMSFAAALQVGVSSVSEYLDVFLTEAVDPAEAVMAAEGVFPDAMPIIAAGFFDGSYTLASKVRSATYLIRPYGKGWGCWSFDEMGRAIGKLLAKESVLITSRDGEPKEARQLIIDAHPMDGGIEAKLSCGNGNLRPQAFMEALKGVSGSDYGISQDILRTGIEVDTGSGLHDPMSDCTGVGYSNKFRS